MQTTEQNKMDHKPVLPLLISMAFPPMLPMLVQLLYNIIDSMFMTQIGEDALTAVFLAFPIQTLVVTCSMGIDVRTNSYITRKLGEQNQKGAGSAAARGLLLSPTGYLLFTTVSSFMVRPFFEMFTDSVTILDDAYMYMYVCIFLCFGCLFYILIEKTFQSMGEIVLPTAMQAAEATANIILNPIMTLGLLGSPAMGVKGAAVVTAIGQIFAMSLPLFIFLTREFDVKLGLRQLHFSWDTTHRILSVGIPNACMNTLDSVPVTGLNSILIQFSSTAISVYGIYYKLQTFVFMPTSDLTRGTMPVMGYNYGTGSHERLLQTLKYAIMMTLATVICDCAIFLLLPTQLLMLFHTSEDILRIGIPALCVIGISSLPATLGFTLPILFQVMELDLRSLIIFLFHQSCITLPLSWLPADWFSSDGIWYPFLIAESIAAGMAVLLFIRIRKKDRVLSGTFVQQSSASQETVC